MSINNEVIAVPATTREQIKSITCDLCGKTFKWAGTDQSPGEVTWTNGDGDVHRTCVSIGEGFSWPGEYSVDYRIYHICLNCFKTKLEPWLMAQGAKPTESETGNF